MGRDGSTITAVLRSVGADEPWALEAAELVPAEASGLLLYGSRARGDHRDDSDVDLLCLVAEPMGSRSRGTLNLSAYTVEQLRSASGTLFGMHLRRDGRVIVDRYGELTRVLAQLAAPDPIALLARVRHFSSLLWVSDDERAAYSAGLVRLARYLLRTAIYAVALRDGRPCFSVRELACRFAQPELVGLLSSDHTQQGRRRRETLADLRARVRDVAGPPVPNPYGSLRALIVAEWDSDRDRAALATLAIADRADGFDYAHLPKVLL